MSQRSHNSHILILHLSNLRLGDQQSIQIGSPIQANVLYKHDSLLYK